MNKTPTPHEVQDIVTGGEPLLVISSDDGVFTGVYEPDGTLVVTHKLEEMAQQDKDVDVLVSTLMDIFAAAEGLDYNVMHIEDETTVKFWRDMAHAESVLFDQPHDYLEEM